MVKTIHKFNGKSNMKVKRNKRNKRTKRTKRNKRTKRTKGTKRTKRTKRTILNRRVKRISQWGGERRPLILIPPKEISQQIQGRAHLYTVIEYLGEGTFGRVYRVEGDDGNEYALKEQMVDLGAAKVERTFKNALRKFIPNVVDYVGDANADKEIKALTALQQHHPCGINKIVESFTGGGERGSSRGELVYICLELAKGGSLQDYLKILNPEAERLRREMDEFYTDFRARQDEIDEPEMSQYVARFKVLEDALDAPQGKLGHHRSWKLATACSISKQLLVALKKIHETGIVHLDIKPDNILIVGPASDELLLPGNTAPNVPNLCVSMADFGSAIFSDDPAEDLGGFAGTLSYMDPLMLSGYYDKVRGESEEIYEYLQGHQTMCEIQSTFDGYKLNDIYSLGLVMFQLFYEGGLNPRIQFVKDKHLELLGEIPENPENVRPILFSVKRYIITARDFMAHLETMTSTGTDFENRYGEICRGLVDLEINDDNEVVGPGSRLSIDVAIDQLDQLITDIAREGRITNAPRAAQAAQGPPEHYVPAHVQDAVADAKLREQEEGAPDVAQAQKGFRLGHGAAALAEHVAPDLQAIVSASSQLPDPSMFNRRVGARPDPTQPGPSEPSPEPGPEPQLDPPVASAVAAGAAFLRKRRDTAAQ